MDDFPAVLSWLFLDDHAAAHFQMQGVTEVGAVEPVHAGFIGLERDRFGFLRIDDKVDVVFRDGEAVGEIFHLVEVGQDDRHLIAAFYGEFRQSERGRDGGQVHRYILALAFHAAILDISYRIRRIVETAYLFRLDQVATDDDRVVRLRVDRVVGDQDHFIAGDVDQLRRLGMQRADRQQPVLGEFVVGDEKFAVRLAGFAHGGEAVPGLVVNVDAIEHRLDGFVALVFGNRLVDIPFDDLAVQEQRGVCIAASVDP